MSLYQGAASDFVAFANNEKPVQMYPQMLRNYEGMTPLTAILSRISAMKATNTRVDWMEQEALPHRVRMTGAQVASGGTNLTIADYAIITKGCLLFVPRTKELIRVTTKPTVASTVTVVRSIGESGTGTVNPNEWLELLPPATVEGDDSHREPVQNTNTNYYNYTQVINEFVRTTKTANAVSTEFGGPGTKRVENQNKLWRNYRVKTEKLLMFGYRSVNSSLYYRTMGGLTEWLANGTNVYSVGGLLTESGLDNWLTDLWTEMADSSKLTLFGSPFLISKIQQMAKPLIRLSPNAKLYGVPQLSQYQGSVNLDLVRCPLLKGCELKGWGFVLDMNRLNVKYLRKPILKKNVAMEAYDYLEDKIESEVTMQMGIEKAHGLIEGVTG